MYISLLTDPKNSYIVSHMHFPFFLVLLIIHITLNTHFSGKGVAAAFFLNIDRVENFHCPHCLLPFYSQSSGFKNVISGFIPR